MRHHLFFDEPSQAEPRRHKHRKTVCFHFAITDVENHETLAPIGATGELLVEDPLVGRGYLSSQDNCEACPSVQADRRRSAYAHPVFNPAHHGVLIISKSYFLVRISSKMQLRTHIRALRYKRAYWTHMKNNKGLGMRIRAGSACRA